MSLPGCHSRTFSLKAGYWKQIRKNINSGRMKDTPILRMLSGACILLDPS